MEFIDIILQNSNLKEAKLFNAAKKAFINPEIGITIENKAAYHVIKDCANITINYLPHYVFGSYQNPFESLKGKFKKETIAEFVKQTETNLPLYQLLYTIIDRAEKLKINFLFSSNDSKASFNEEAPTNPYGDYGTDQPAPAQKNITPFEILCKLFAAS